MTEKANKRGGSRPGAGRKSKSEPVEIKREKNQTSKAPTRRGGARPGAGRKPKAARDIVKVEKKVTKTGIKQPVESQSHNGSSTRKKSEPVEVSERDMLNLLRDIALGKIDASHIQVRAAIAAVQYTHSKMPEGGKKEAKEVAAKKAAKGRFASTPPPKLVYSKKDT